MSDEPTKSTKPNQLCDIDNIERGRPTTTNSTRLRQARYWMVTIPATDWQPDHWNTTGASFVKGQLERGDSGYEHYQLIAYYAKKTTISKLKNLWPRNCHLEPTRSAAAEQYVWKEQTRIGEVLIY